MFAPPARCCLLCLVVMSAALLNACGGGASSNGIANQSPGAILTAAKSAADAATSVHVTGATNSGGAPTTFDMHLLAGRGGRGQLTQNGVAFTLIRLGPTAYLSGSAAFWRRLAGGPAAQLLTGRWLKAPATRFGAANSLTDLRSLVDSTLSSHGALTKGATTTVAGQRVVQVNDAGQGGTLSVATTGKPYPIEIAQGKGGPGKVVFDHWNDSVSLSAPPSPIDISQLQLKR